MINSKEQEEACKERFELQIRELETEIKQLKSAEREPVVMSCSHEEEIIQLQVCIHPLLISLISLNNLILL